MDNHVFSLACSGNVKPMCRNFVDVVLEALIWETHIDEASTLKFWLGLKLMGALKTNRTNEEKFQQKCLPNIQSCGLVTILTTLK